MSEYRFERISEKHYSDLVYISKSAFGIDPGLEYYRKKNSTKYCGEPHLGFIAYSYYNEPSAFYGVYAYPVEFDGKVYYAVQSGDTMTHKNHEGKGLFTTLAKMTYELAVQTGAKFVFGFPNYNSYPGFVKRLGWVHKENLKEYKIKVFTIPLLKAAKKFSFLKPLYNIYFHLISIFYQPLKQSFQSSVLEKQIGGIYRSKEFIKYKSFSGSKILKLGGLHLLIKPDGFLYLGDIERSENFDLKKVLKDLKRFAFFIGADVIIFQTSPDTFLDKLFSQYYQHTEGLPIGYLDFNSGLPVDKLKFNSGDLDTF